jgi:eukaryotic-like serine/threonine-protein kinase
MPSVFPPGARLGLRYRVARVIAHGPIAAVYEAHDLDSGEVVAFKWLHAPTDQHETLSRLAERARQAQRLRDPGLATVHDVVREDDSLFVVSSWERGEPYSHLLAHQLMPLSQRLAALAAVMSALAAGHRAGVAHCGLHPDNVYLASRSGVAVRVLDLALNQTCCATMFGAPQQVAAGHHVFMAPEQLEPHYTPNVRTDVFAAAVLAFQALSGRLPFSAPDVEGLRKAHAHEPPAMEVLRAEMPRTLSTLLAACLALRPEQRPGDLEELRGQLTKFAHEVVTPLATDEVPEPPPMSATQWQARGELVVTSKDVAASDAETAVMPAPAPEPEAESVSQPISFHGEHRVRSRWHLWVATGLAMCAMFVVASAMLPRPRAPTCPPPLPAVPQVLRVSPSSEPEREAVEPDAAKPVRRKHRARRRAVPEFRSGRPLSRDDF